MQIGTGGIMAVNIGILLVDTWGHSFVLCLQIKFKEYQDE